MINQLIGYSINHLRENFPSFSKEGWLREAETGWCWKTCSFYYFSFFPRSAVCGPRSFEVLLFYLFGNCYEQSSGDNLLSDSRPIGVFDSGIGGLTVVHEVFRKLPAESVIYFGDTARVPYGTKSAASVQRFAVQDAAFLMRYDVKMLIIACHTASAFAMPILQDRFDTPILGVTEPGIEAAIRETRNRRIGVIGTRGTIQSNAYANYLKKRRPEVKLYSQACPLFVPLVEEGWLDHSVTREITEIYLAPVLRNRIDTLILGCTHYPLLKPVIQEVAGSTVRLIDSAEETASRVREQLAHHDLLNESDAPPSHRFFVSDIPAQFQQIGERFLGRPLGVVSQVEIETG
jgi:glutamate racemase